MKRELLNKLVCPLCRNDTLKLMDIKLDNTIEIREGNIICSLCHQKYEITKGIPNFLLNPEIQNKYISGDARIPSLHCDTKFTLADLAQRKNLNKKWVQSSQKDFKQIMSMLDLSACDDVLEIGAGTCWAIQEFAKACKQCVALDIIWNNKLEYSDYWIYENGHYFERILGDADHTNFKDQSFDIIFSIATIMYSSNVTALFADLYRMLKPNGVLLLIDEPIASCWLTETKKKMGSGRSYSLFEWHNIIRQTHFIIKKRIFPASIKQRFITPDIINKKDTWYYCIAQLVNKLSYLPIKIPIGWTVYLWQIFGFVPLVVMLQKKKINGKKNSNIFWLF